MHRLLLPIVFGVSACASYPRIPPPSQGTTIRVEMVVVTRAREDLDLTGILRQGIARRIANHRAIVLDEHDRGETFPSPAYVERAAACADARNRGVDYVLQIDAMLGGNASGTCGSGSLQRSCANEPRTQTTGELITRITWTASCQDVTREHRASVLEPGPQARSEPAAIDDLVNAIGGYLDDMLP